jgi:type IV secretory pathway protease TraF
MIKRHKKKILGFLGLLVLLSQTGIWINRSNSLKGRAFFIYPGRVKRGDLVGFKRGDLQVIKKVVGLPGDPITYQNGYVMVRGQSFEVVPGHEPLKSGGEGYFVVGSHPHSFDSRYAAFGLIKDVVGKAVRIL